jgi:hypothetical protein
MTFVKKFHKKGGKSWFMDKLDKRLDKFLLSRLAGEEEEETRVRRDPRFNSDYNTTPRTTNMGNRCWMIAISHLEADTMKFSVYKSFSVSASSAAARQLRPHLVQAPAMAPSQLNEGTEEVDKGEMQEMVNSHVQ